MAEWPNRSSTWRRRTAAGECPPRVLVPCHVRSEPAFGHSARDPVKPMEPLTGLWSLNQACPVSVVSLWKRDTFGAGSANPDRPLVHRGVRSGCRVPLTCSARSHGGRCARRRGSCWTDRAATGGCARATRPATGPGQACRCRPHAVQGRPAAACPADGPDTLLSHGTPLPLPHLHSRGHWSLTGRWLMCW